MCSYADLFFEKLKQLVQRAFLMYLTSILRKISVVGYPYQSVN
jgi:hypothetical protein